MYPEETQTTTSKNCNCNAEIPLWRARGTKAFSLGRQTCANDRHFLWQFVQRKESVAVDAEIAAFDLKRSGFASLKVRTQTNTGGVRGPATKKRPSLLPASQ